MQTFHAIEFSEFKKFKILPFPESTNFDRIFKFFQIQSRTESGELFPNK